jgi:hypothetical protein
MGPISKQIKAGDAVRVARKLGFEIDLQKENKAIFYRSLENVWFGIPIHMARYIKPKCPWYYRPAEYTPLKC